MISVMSARSCWRCCFLVEDLSTDFGGAGSWVSWSFAGDVGAATGTSCASSLRFLDAELCGAGAGVCVADVCFGRTSIEFSSCGNSRLLSSVESLNSGLRSILFCRFRGLMPFSTESSRSGVRLLTSMACGGRTADAVDTGAAFGGCAAETGREAAGDDDFDCELMAACICLRRCALVGCAFGLSFRATAPDAKTSC
jgi:hypothetical protein